MSRLLVPRRALLRITTLALVSGVACRRDDQSEVHLIPVSFTGPVVIVFGDPRGVPLTREGGRRIYRIPPSGALLFRDPAPAGTKVDRQYFYVRPDGTRRPLVDASYAPPANVLQIFGVTATRKEQADSAPRTTFEYVVGVPFERRDWIERRLQLSGRI